MASNTPGASMRMLRSFSSIPHIPRGPSGPNYARAYGGGAGRNPLGSERDDSGQGDFIAPPIHVGGLIGLGLDPQRDKEYEERVNARDTARMQKVQAGVDAYQQALEKTGDPKAALAQVFHTDSEGHVHFSDPQTFGAILQMHQAAMQGQPQTDWKTTDLGNGLTGITDPNGKTSVHQAKAVAGAKPEKPVMVGGKPFIHDPANPGNLIPMTQSSPVKYDSQGNVVAGSGQPQGFPDQPGKTGVLDAGTRDKLSAAANLYQGLSVMGALSGQATGLPAGFLQHLGGAYLGTNDPAAMWDIAKRQVENNAGFFYGKGQMTTYKEFTKNLGTYNEAPRFNMGLANQFKSDTWNISKNEAAFAEQKLKAPLPSDVASDLEQRMGIYGQTRKDVDPLSMLSTNPSRLSDDQMDDLIANRHRMNPQQWQGLIQENDRRLHAAQPVQSPVPQQSQAPIASPGAPPGRPMYPHGAPASSSAADYMSGQASPQELMQGIPGANAASPSAPTAEAQPAQNPLAPDAAEMQRQQDNQELLQQTQQLLQQTGM